MFGQTNFWINFFYKSKFLPQKKFAKNISKKRKQILANKNFAEKIFLPKRKFCWQKKGLKRIRVKKNFANNFFHPNIILYVDFMF